MKKIVFATNNKHKLEEVRSILDQKYEILSLQDLDCTEDIPETSETLEGNALQKAHYVKEKYGYDCFADDTGLEVKSLHNAPGVYSARYAGDAKNFAANTAKLLHELKNKTDRRARFRTVIAFLTDDSELLFEGIITGTILEEEKGDAGFGYDPVFVPDGYTQTFAELGNEIKNTISHRAIAVGKLVNYLQEMNILYKS